MEEIAKRLNEAIEKSGLSYREISDKVGVSHTTIMRYANGDTDKIPISVLQLISDVIGTPPEHILGWDTETSHNTVTGNGNIIGNGNYIGHNLSEQESALLSLFGQMDVLQQAKLLTVAAEMLK